MRKDAKANSKEAAKAEVDCITQRSQVQILSPLPHTKEGVTLKNVAPSFCLKTLLGTVWEGLSLACLCYDFVCWPAIDLPFLFKSVYEAAVEVYTTVTFKMQIDRLCAAVGSRISRFAPI